ncbi:MAG: hypothetical protein NC095_03510 [Muribaculum sp.]|nr:hypothetical protein [Muribaculum sp.]
MCILSSAMDGGDFDLRRESGIRRLRRGFDADFLYFNASAWQCKVVNG